MGSEITEELKTKYVKGFKLQLNGVLGVFHIHGLQIYIPDAIEVITELALLLHKSLNGAEEPITLEYAEIKRQMRYKKEDWVKEE